MKNERSKPNNPTEMRTIPARTQTAKPYSELGMNSLHRIQADYIAPSPRQQSCPAAADSPRGEEVESRGWRRGAPQSPSPSSFGAPQGNNKIYRSDAVFLMEESQNKRPTRGQRKSYERKSKTHRSRRHERSTPPIMKNERL